MGGDICRTLRVFLLVTGPVTSPKYRMPMEPILVLLQAIAFVCLARNDFAARQRIIKFVLRHLMIYLKPSSLGE